MVSPRVATKPSRRIVEALTTSPTNNRSNGADTYICTLIAWRPCACRCIGVTLRRLGSEARPRGSRRQPVRAPTCSRYRRICMKQHELRVSPSKANLPREDQLAWKIAGVAADRVGVERDVSAMIVNRIIDNASVAIAAINRRPVTSARDMALGHARKDGATVFGVPANK